MAEIQDIDAKLATVGAPVDGGCCYVNFSDSPQMPTDATTELGEGWVSLGEISENGYTETNSVESEVLKGWHGTPYITLETSESTTYKVEFLEVNREAVAKLRYGAENVQVDEDGSVKHISSLAGKRKPVALVFDELESNGYRRRTAAKNCSITSMDDISHTKGALIIYGMEFSVNDTDGKGAFNIYRAKPATGEPDESGEA